jgi:L-asparaginase II
MLRAMEPIVAEILRGGRIESVHHGVVAVTRGGKPALRRGDVSRPVFLRSCAKPIQALAVIESGAPERFGLSEAEIALISSSHDGTGAQRAAASSILSKAGLSEADLRCGAHPPTDKEARAGLAREGREPTQIYSNCSGKHAGMLAACKARGWPIEGYLDPAHPLQRANLQAVRRLTGARRIPVAIDGCSAPTFAAPLWRLALAYERLFAGRDPAGARVARAILSNPDMMSGLISPLLRAGIVAKEGAEGVLAAAIPGEGIGIAVKILDGSFRPLLPLVAAICRRLRRPTGDAGRAVAALANGVQTNFRGIVTGELRIRL